MARLRPLSPDPMPSGTPPEPLDWREVAPVAAVAAAMQFAVWVVLYAAYGVFRVGYGFFAFSDIIGTYYPYAVRIASGMAAYRDFFIEYPPLFVPLLTVLGNPVSPADFAMRFAALMIAFMLAAGMATAIAAIDGAGLRRPLGVAAVFSALVFALGPITANRYDAVVAFVLALTMLLAMREDWELAGIALGIGFALKITPAMLLPLVLMLAPARRALRALAGFALAAALPFLWVLALGGLSGERLVQMLGYHLDRPLEIESVLATPLWVGRLTGAPLDVATASGSQVIVSGAARALAAGSIALLVSALSLTFWLVWRRRRAILADKRLFALATLATLLGSLVGSKVLSPQYFVWIIPAAALAAMDHKTLGVLLAIVLVLTHALFPANYLGFAIDQLPGPIVLVIVRNLLVVAAFGLSLWHLWTVPDVVKPRRKR